MRCYIKNCKRQVVGSQGGLLTHYFLCRKHFDRERLDEQLEKEDEDTEDEDEDECKEEISNIRIILTFIVASVIAFWLSGAMIPSLAIEAKVTVAVLIALLYIHTSTDIIDEWMKKLKEKLGTKKRKRR